MSMARRSAAPGPCALSRLFLCAGIAILSGLGVEAAFAQTADDMRPLYDRMDRLERDLNLLQRQVYRGAVETGEAAPIAPEQAGAAPKAVTGMEVRLNQIEDQMRALTGRIEESNHRVDELKNRLDKLVVDVDNRLTALERTAESSKAVAAGAQPGLQPGVQPGAQPGATPVAGIGETAPADVTPSAPTEGVLPNPPPVSEKAVATAPGPQPLPTGTPLEQYQQARALLAQANYVAAEATLKNFVKTYPDNELAENAHYWLGETYYVRSDYKNAAIAFAEGYQKFPNGPKAPDNLLKLGMSLANLGETEQACKTFAEIEKKFPQADANVRERAANERKQRGCK
jgi:tol-pal system protein YbgF